MAHTLHGFLTRFNTGAAVPNGVGTQSRSKCCDDQLAAKRPYGVTPSGRSPTTACCVSAILNEAEGVGGRTLCGLAEAYGRRCVWRVRRWLAASRPVAPWPRPMPRRRRPVRQLTGAARYGAVFDRWVAKHQPNSAILVVRRDGKTVFAKGAGADPMQPTMIASLSKPITGACVATLIRDGKVSFTTRLREGLSRFFHRYGKPADPRLADVTVEQLLVHRSGLMGNGEDDPIYGVMNKRAYTGKGYLAPIQAVLSEYLAKLHLIREPGTKYAYSNTGYEVLSAMIEERTGQSYEDYCREAVFGQARHRGSRI